LKKKDVRNSFKAVIALHDRKLKQYNKPKICSIYSGTDKKTTCLTQQLFRFQLRRARRVLQTKGEEKIVWKIMKNTNFSTNRIKGKNWTVTKLPVITSLSHVTTTADEFWTADAANATALGN